MGRGQQPLPTARGSGSAVSSPSGVRGGVSTTQKFLLFSALRMASPDTIILLIVDYHAAIGDKTPVAPLRTALAVDNKMAKRVT